MKGEDTVRYKRNEAWRYEFMTPHDATFYISGLKERDHQSSSGKGVMLNISPGGLRLKTLLSLPDKEGMRLTFAIDIAGQTITPEGHIIWKKSDGKHFIYGVDFVTDEFEQQIIKAVKAFRKSISS